MLFYKTVEPKLLELLRGLQKIKIFDKLQLVGGTALALQKGHRKSVDLDLFGELNAEDLEIIQELKTLGEVKLINRSKNISVYLVDGVKIDIVNYRYPWIGETIIEGDLRLASIEDISAMKLNAISGRGTKKDFVDLYFLLQQFSLSELMRFYHEKYDDGSTFLVLKSLTYFEDAENQEMPVMINTISWNQVKEFILQQVKLISSD